MAKSARYLVTTRSGTYTTSTLAEAKAVERAGGVPPKRKRSAKRRRNPSAQLHLKRGEQELHVTRGRLADAQGLEGVKARSKGVKASAYAKQARSAYTSALESASQAALDLSDAGIDYEGEFRKATEAMVAAREGIQRNPALFLVYSAPNAAYAVQMGDAFVPIEGQVMWPVRSQLVRQLRDLGLQVAKSGKLTLAARRNPSADVHRQLGEQRMEQAVAMLAAADAERHPSYAAREGYLKTYGEAKIAASDFMEGLPFGSPEYHRAQLLADKAATGVMKNPAKRRNPSSNATTNRAFLAKLDAVTRDKILASIAKHYGIGVQDVMAEVSDPEAEHLLDYMTEPERSATSVLMQRHGFLRRNPSAAEHEAAFQLEHRRAAAVRKAIKAGAYVVESTGEMVAPNAKAKAALVEADRLYRQLHQRFPWYHDTWYFKNPSAEEVGHAVGKYGAKGAAAVGRGLAAFGRGLWSASKGAVKGVQAAAAEAAAKREAAAKAAAEAQKAEAKLEQKVAALPAPAAPVANPRKRRNPLFFVTLADGRVIQATQPLEVQHWRDRGAKIQRATSDEIAFFAREALQNSRYETQAAAVSHTADAKRGHLIAAKDEATKALALAKMLTAAGPVAKIRDDLLAEIQPVLDAARKADAARNPAKRRKARR